MAFTMRTVDNFKNVTHINKTVFDRVDTKNYLNQKLKVCAYCRVSTELESQQSSFDTQVQFYTKYINDNPNWTLAGIYADDGLSGSQIYWRNGFTKMIEDAKQKKFDLVITKSFTRFARNTVDSVKTVREFSELGIDIYFEDKGLHTLEQRGELMVTFYSAFAQEELRNLSDNISWGYAKKFERGEVIIPVSMLGYKNVNKVIEVVETEARTVRLIYRLFLEGNTYYQIKLYLEKHHIPTKSGKFVWHVTTIKSILMNEKYTGNALCQKSISIDYLKKTRKKNDGEKKMFYVKNSHPMIVPQEIFDLAQEERAARETASLEMKQRKPDTKTTIRSAAIDYNNHYSSKYALSNIVFCKECGFPYRRFTWTAQGKSKHIWMCAQRKQTGGRKRCPNSPSIEEDELHRCIVAAVNQVIQSNDDENNSAVNFVRENYLFNLKESEKLENEISLLKEMKIDLEAQQKKIAQDLFGKLEYEVYMNKVESEYKDTVRQISEKELLLSKYRILNRRIDDISSELGDEKLVEYSDELVKKLIQRIEIDSKKVISVFFKNGMKFNIISNESR